jgi:hypothetical protein
MKLKNTLFNNKIKIIKYKKHIMVNDLFAFATRLLRVLYVK